ncbi:U32 family peptidase [Actinocrispum wychmicini]|uniref:Peptidase U32-like protein n=1 Tax=Actinocrispum wychmicini TaxID=1213861 RepID=A0A4R2J806_9PSEU|nr:U32 family peptidase [Actinocrispum wychmicini]TCO54327.1 peptidase U32-like protein [Actinocrispum wychmicini]
MSGQSLTARPVQTTGELLVGLGLPDEDLPALPGATGRFPDGAHHRVEIPSVEGPACLEAVLAEADRLRVPVTRVSQGTGIGLLTDAEIRAMVTLCASAGIELSMFARPCAGWDASAMSMAPAGGLLAAAARGQDQVAAVVDEIRRAADLGVRSVLIADLGVLHIFGRLRASGVLPGDMRSKVSAMIPVANPATAQVLDQLGADTLNLPTDLTLAQIATIRVAVPIPLDVYVEAPDNLGGFVRHYELPRLVQLAAPVHVKFGLRNAPDIYPSGSHLEPLAIALSKERVRRARLGLDLLERAGSTATHSVPHATGLAIPVV